MINFLLHTSLLLSLSYFIYKLFLQKETFFKLNRYVLLTMVLFSITFPFAEVPASWSFRSGSQNLVEFITPEGLFHEVKSQEGTNITLSGNEVTSKPLIENKNEVPFILIFYWIYFAGVAVFFITFLVQLIQLRLNSKKLEFIQDGPFRIYELIGNVPPFSFFNSIYINPSHYNYETYQQILEHEKFHIQSRHYVDKLVAESLLIFFWFWPFSWLLRKAIHNNLEFQTDDAMLENGAEQESYEMSLLKVSVNQQPLSFTNNYNQTILERRIRMMNTKKSSMKSIWKYLMLLPIFSLALSFNGTNKGGDDILLEDNYTYRYDHIEEILVEGSFKTQSDDNTLILANITGKITIEGHKENTIEISAIKTINAPSEAQINKGVKEIKLGRNTGEKSFALYLDSPYSKFNTETNEFSYSENCNGQPCFDYRFSMDYTIKIPENTNVIVQNVNGGDISISGLSGKWITAKHITGSITMENVSGETKAETISGSIKAIYNKVPTGNSSYKTVSGFIEATYPEDFSGTVFQRAGDGSFTSDFEVDSKYKKNGRMRKSFQIGSSAAEFRFETTSGDILLKSKRK